MIFVGTIEQGKLDIDFSANFDRWLSTLEGQRVTVEVKKFRKNRTLPQMRYYFGVVIERLLEPMGYRKDEKEKVHQIMKYKFLRTIDDNGNEYVPTLSEITKVDTVQMGEYLDQIKIFAAQELNTYIPDANEEVTE